jgi:hypothetical protein
VRVKAFADAMLALEMEAKQVRQYDARRPDGVAERCGSGCQHRGPAKFRLFRVDPSEALQACSGLARVVDDIGQLEGIP